MTDEMIPAPLGHDADVRVELVKVPAGAMGITVRWLGQWSGLRSHYRGERGSLPCDQQYECQGCRRREVRQWRGYASVLHWDAAHARWLHAVLEVTERLAEQLQGLLLRGREDQLRRVEVRKDRYAVQALPRRDHAPESLPDPCDVQAFCESLFRWPGLIMGATDPRPAAQYLAPVAPVTRPSLLVPPPAASAGQGGGEAADCPTRVESAMGRQAAEEVAAEVARRWQDRLRGRPSQ